MEVRNPPYQDDTILNSRKPPVYHLFMDEASKVAGKVELITPARFLFNAGQTPKEWNRKMLSDRHFKILYFEPNGELVFPNTDIKGGVVISYRDINIDQNPIEIFSPFQELNSIRKKVESSHPISLSSIMIGAVPYKYSQQMSEDLPEAKKLAGKSYDVRTNALNNLQDIAYFDKPLDESYVGVLGLLNRCV